VDGFEKRTKLAALLEENFIGLFNERFGDRFLVVKYGIETTNLKEVHGKLRTCHDPTSHLVRYVPDSVLVEVKRDGVHRKCRNRLVEFKAAETGLYSERFFNEIRENCPEVPFNGIADVFNVEKDALDLYAKLEKGLGVPTVVVAFAAYREDLKLFAQYASKIGVCNEYNPNLKGKNRGSGTILYNVSLATFRPLSDFLVEELGLNPSEVSLFISELEGALGAR